MGCTCSKELPLGHSEIGQENDLPSFQIPIPSTNEDQQPIGRDTQDENNEMGTSKIQEDNAPFGNCSTTDGINVNLEMIPSKNANGKNENSNGHHSVLPSELSNSISTADLLGPEAGNDKESYSSRASSVVSLPHICEDPNSTAAEDQQVSFMKSFYSTQFSPSQNKDKLLEELVAELNAVAENRSWEAVSSVLLKLYSIVFYEKTPYGNPRLPLSLSTSSALRPHERLRLHGAALLHPLPFPSEWRLQPALRASAAVFLRQQPQSEQTPPVLRRLGRRAGTDHPPASLRAQRGHRPQLPLRALLAPLPPRPEPSLSSPSLTQSTSPSPTPTAAASPSSTTIWTSSTPSRLKTSSTSPPSLPHSPRAPPRPAPPTRSSPPSKT